MVDGLLMELEDHNCWTIAEARAAPIDHSEGLDRSNMQLAA